MLLGHRRIFLGVVDPVAQDPCICAYVCVCVRGGMPPSPSHGAGNCRLWVIMGLRVACTVDPSGWAGLSVQSGRGVRRCLFIRKKRLSSIATPPNCANNILCLVNHGARLGALPGALVCGDFGCSDLWPSLGRRVLAALGRRVLALGLVWPLVWMTGTWGVLFLGVCGCAAPFITECWCLLLRGPSSAGLCCSALGVGLWLSMDWLALTWVLPSRGHSVLCLAVLLVA